VTFFLGIDGGGTQTTCVIGDDTAILGTGIAGGSNVVRVGEQAASEALTTAIRQACAAAKVDPSQIKRVCIGAAGAARPEIQQAIRRIVSSLISGEIEIVGDTVTSLEAAFGEGPGVIVIAGTGSIAYGRNARGQTARAGGWGFAISDEGSGHWIGRTALSAALHDRDEGGNPKLFEDARKMFGASSDEELIVKANAAPDFAALVPAILAAADAGDVLSNRVLTLAGNELANLVKALVSRLFAKGERVPVAMVGGVFRNSALVRQVFYNSVRSSCPAAEVQQAIVEPVQGALARARRGASRG
jgi:glucosamine kinase